MYPAIPNPQKHLFIRTGSDLTTYQLLTEGEEGKSKARGRRKREQLQNVQGEGAESWDVVDPVRMPVSWVQAEC